jgi:hypothetical protein
MVCLTSQRSWLAITRSKFQPHYSQHHSEGGWLSPDQNFSHTTATVGYQQYSKQQILTSSGYILHYQIKYSTTVLIYPRNKKKVLSTIVVLFIYKNVLHSSKQ